MKLLAISLIAAATTLAFGAAQAQPTGAGDIRIVVTSAGLDLHSAAGASAFNQRIKAAAFKACMDSRGIDNTLAAESLLGDCVRHTVKAALTTVG